MTKDSTLSAVDALTEDASRAGPASNDASRSAAMIRALADEVDRHHPSDSKVAALRTQLGDELTRLAEVVRPGSAEYETSHVAPLEVLVVDDDPASVDALMSALGALGFVCRSAPDAADALREYERAPASIVVTDWNMPGMSGLELAVELKKRSPHAYVILATAHPESVRHLEGLRGGADDFLHKPIDLDELARRMAAATRLVRAVRTVQKLGDSMRPL